MANRRKSNTGQRRKGGGTTRKPSRNEVERISRQNARGLVRGTNRLRSWGYSGWYKSQRLNKYFNFRSKLEKKVIQTLDNLVDLVENFDAEKVIIPYHYKGAQLNYVPDIILKTTRGDVYIFEVKYKKDLDKDKNKEKWEAARDFAAAYGVTFKVITEDDLPKLPEILRDRNVLTEEEKRGAN